MPIPGVSPYLPPYLNKPVLNPTINPAPVANPQSFLHKEIEYVKGLEGATNYPLAPNSSVILPDQDMAVVWIVATDQSGNKTMVKGFHLGDEYIPPKPVTMEDLMAEMKDMKERLMRVEGEQNEPDSKSAVKNKPVWTGNGAGQRSGPGAAERKPNADHGTEQSANAAGNGSYPQQGR